MPPGQARPVPARPGWLGKVRRRPERGGSARRRASCARAGVGNSCISASVPLVRPRSASLACRKQELPPGQARPVPGCVVCAGGRRQLLHFGVGSAGPASLSVARVQEAGVATRPGQARPGGASCARAGVGNSCISASVPLVRPRSASVGCRKQELPTRPGPSRHGAARQHPARPGAARPGKARRSPARAGPVRVRRRRGGVGPPRRRSSRARAGVGNSCNGRRSAGSAPAARRSGA